MAAPTGPRGGIAATARQAVATNGGRFSLELGIDVDAGAHEIDRWLLAASLFGTRISAAIALRTYRTLDEAGVSTLDDLSGVRRSTIVALLEAGGYARYDERTATRLVNLADRVREAFPDGLDAWGRGCRTAGELVAGLDALPGWGPVTVHAFLRELRGVWPAADLPPDERAVRSAGRLGLVPDGRDLDASGLRRLARAAGVDPRDLEAALVRQDLERHRAPRMAT
jgi:hypothetical protein